MPLILRPELLLSEDGKVGAGGAVLYDLSRNLDFPRNHALALGPRVVYHNADDHGWAGDAMAIWGYDLGGDTQAWRHSLEMIRCLSLSALARRG